MSKFDIKSAVINRFLRLTEVDLESGMVNWVLRNIENPQTEFTGESVDKTDERGILISRFDTAKGFTLSGESSKLELGLMASQLGTEVQVATTDKKIKGEDFEVISIVEDASGAKKATMAYTPLTTPSVVYAINKDKSLGDPIEVGTEDTNAKIAGNVITLPASYEGTRVGVLYQYETDEAVRVTDSSETFNKNAKYIAKILAEDVCGVTAAITIVVSKGKLDNNFSLNLTTEGNHPFKISAMKDYCSEEEELCYILVGKAVGVGV